MTRAYVLAFLFPVAMILYCFFYLAPSGYHPTDQDYILSYAWRIFQFGDVPYRDFIYPRLPTSLYFHSFWFFFPKDFVLLASRFGFYLQMFLIGFLPFFWAVKARFLTLTPITSAIITCCILLSLHIFPAMPWHTVDGIFFLVLGVTFLLWSISSTKLFLRAISSLFFVFGMLAKQNFALYALVIVVSLAAEFIFLVRKKQNFFAIQRLLASILPALFFIFFYIFFLYQSKSLAPLIEQLTKASQPTALKQCLQVIYDYGRPAFFWLGFFLSFSFLASKKSLSFFPKKLAQLLFITLWIFTLSWLTYLIYMYLSRHHDSPLPASMWWLWLGSIFGSLSCVRFYVFSSREKLLLLASLLYLPIPFLTTISWGYITPVLGLGTLWLAFAPFLSDLTLQKNRFFQVTVMLASFACIFCFHLINTKITYQEQPRPFLTMNLGETFSRLSGIYSHPQALERLHDLKELTERPIFKNKEFISAPDFPLLHFLTNSHPSTNLSWYLEAEITHFKEKVIADLETKKPLAILEKHPTLGEKISPPPACEDVIFKLDNTVVQHIIRNWKQVGSSQYFCVFEKS